MPFFFFAVDRIVQYIFMFGLSSYCKGTPEVKLRFGMHACTDYSLYLSKEVSFSQSLLGRCPVRGPSHEGHDRSHDRFHQRGGLGVSFHLRNVREDPRQRRCI